MSTSSPENLTLENFALIYNEYIQLTHFISQSDKPKDDLEAVLIVAILPIIILVGIFGNTLNIIIFSKKHLRRCSTFRFLMHLSLIDLLVLIICAPDALFNFGFHINIRQYSSFVCRYHTYFTYVLTQTSSTILMMISVDRALVMRNKSFYFDILRLKKFENIEIKGRHGYLCGLSVCCILHCGFSSKLNYRSFMHRSDLITIIVVICLMLLNAHNLFFMNISTTSNEIMQGIGLNPPSFFSNNTNLTSNFYSIDQINNNSFCYPLEGK